MCSDPTIISIAIRALLVTINFSYVFANRFFFLDMVYTKVVLSMFSNELKLSENRIDAVDTYCELR